jgi:hypothetical protein
MDFARKTARKRSKSGNVTDPGPFLLQRLNRIAYPATYSQSVRPMALDEPSAEFNVRIIGIKTSPQMRPKKIVVRIRLGNVFIVAYLLF